MGVLSEFNINEDTSNMYIISEEFAYKDGSCYPSSGHVNGLAFNTHYLANHNDQQTFINALTNYGFGSNIVGCNMFYENGTGDCNPRQPGTAESRIESLNSSNTEE